MHTALALLAWVAWIINPTSAIGPPMAEHNTKAAAPVIGAAAAFYTL
jgi:hypothetical protein